MSLNKVYIVVNANERIGLGHLTRCMFLANEFRLKNVTIEFVSYVLSIKGQNIIKKEKYDLTIYSCKEDVVKIGDSMLKFDDKLILIDSDNDYFYGEDIQDEFLSLGVKLMFITVKNQFKFKSHFLLNQNIIALSQDYNTDKRTIKMLGPDYFIISDRFKSINKEEIINRRKSSNLLVTFGGSDPNNVTEKVLHLLKDKISLYSKITVVVGGMNSNKELILNHPVVKINSSVIEVIIDTKEMENLISDSDVAITSLGLTFWEIMLHEVPCILISGSKRENDQISFFCSRKFAHYMGDFDDLDWEEKWSANLNEFNPNKLLYKELSDKINVNGKTKIVEEIISNF
jgi:spore coat polysaccharide biosynthesis predicted glycosyltransferase SpsG